MAERPEELFRNLEPLGSATHFAKDIIANINDVPLFQGLDTPEVLMIARQMPCYRAPKKLVLLQEGASGDFLLLLLDGEVEVWKLDAQGVNHKLSVAKKGTTLGEMSLLDGAPRSATCITSTAVDFAVLDRSEVNKLLDTNPRLCAKFVLLLLQTMTRRLRESTNRMLNFDTAPPV